MQTRETPRQGQCRGESEGTADGGAVAPVRITHPADEIPQQRRDGYVTISTATYDELVRDAQQWRTLNRSPHVAALMISEFAEWADRKETSESSGAISAAVNWRKVNNPSYAELERRRHHYEHEPLTPEQIRERAAKPWGVTG